MIYEYTQTGLWLLLSETLLLVSYQHALGIDRLSDQPQDFAAPLYIVTASVDRLDLLHPLLATADYRLSGQVIYVGLSFPSRRTFVWTTPC